VEYFDGGNVMRPAAYAGMTTSQVTCPCGALYERTEFNAAVPETDRFDCQICDETLERFTKPKTPSYRLIVGPVRGSDGQT
jgi:hypothetical protein